MSFSSATKSELCRIPLCSNCCILAELSALLYINGTITFLGQEKIRLRLNTENASVARRVFKLMKKLYHINPEILVRKNRRLRKNNCYVLVIPQSSQAKRILESTHVLYTNEENHTDIYMGIHPELIKNDCCKRAYLRGVFLGGGSISDPGKNYHLEIVTHNFQYGISLCQLMKKLNLHAKVVKRKNNYMLYLKEGENIVYFLNIIGAHGALLELENIRIYKDMRNNVNRIVNCETANLSKTVNAALRQVENIKYIQTNIGLNKLSPALREIAELRLHYTHASLKELGEMLTPPVGKSGVNHRLRKLDEIAEDLRKKGEI